MRSTRLPLAWGNISMYQDNESPGVTLFLMCVFAFLALLTCGGCGAAPDSRLSDTPHTWDDRLRPHLKTFVHEMGTIRDSYSALRNHELPAVLAFADLPDGLAGVCFYSDAAGEIYIDISYAASPAILQLVVAHELSHCTLHADHDPRDGEILSSHVPSDVARWTPARWTTAWDRLGEVAP